MRNRGAITLVLAIIGYLYCAAKQTEAPPLAPGLGLREILSEPAGRWEAGQYACAVVGAVGAIFLFLPRPK
jgi:hypothetical protein